MTDEIKNQILTEVEVANLCGISQPMVRKLVGQEILIRSGRNQYRLEDVVKGYALYQIAKNGGSNDGEVDGKLEKALLTRMQKEKAELELGVMRGELHSGEDVRAVMSDMIGNCRARLLALPTKLSPLLLGQSEMAIVQGIIKSGIFEALTELSEYSPKKFNDRNKKAVTDESTDDS